MAAPPVATPPTLTKKDAVAAIAEATKLLEEEANATQLKTAVEAAAGNPMMLMAVAGPVVANLLQATLKKHGFSVDQMGVLALLAAIRPHTATDPAVHASATALAGKFLPPVMLATFLPPPATATAPPAAAAPAPAP